MEQNALFPIPGSFREEAKKRTLKQRISVKRERLQRFVTKTEMLRVDLEMVRQEYDVRIGKLFIKDNQLDLEIIHFRNILELMQEGLLFEEAIAKLHEKYYAEQRKIDAEKEKIRFEEEIVEKRHASQKPEILHEIKSVWKKLIARFHPDLVQDTEEKIRRENVMKQINKAYEEYNLDELIKIENEAQSEVTEETTVEKLEEILVSLENELIDQAVIYQELRNSEWFNLRIKIDKARRRNKDIFKDIERKLLNDIVDKYAILHELKKQVG